MIQLKPKQRYREREIVVILDRLDQAAAAGFLLRQHSKNQYVRAAYRGIGTISRKWNVQVYYATVQGAAVVSVDFYVLNQLVNHQGAGLVISGKRVISIDDSGWGFPLCGVMVGAANDQRVVTAVVPVQFFRDPQDFQIDKTYLQQYSKLGLGLVARLGCTPERHRIEICTGFINSVLRDHLCAKGYETWVVEIKGLLQQQLEQAFRQHVEQTVGQDLYRDPKAVSKQEVPRVYQAAVQYGQQHCPDLLKTGWRSLAHLL